LRVPRNLATKEFDRIKTDFLSIWFELEFEENGTENGQLPAVNETGQRMELAVLVQQELAKFKSLVELDTPRQPNGYDCGVCVCINMEILTRMGDALQLDFGSQ